MNIICYLAGPIDYEEDKGASWKERLLDIHSGDPTASDIGFFDPQAPFKCGTIDKDMAEFIHDVNMKAMEKSDIIVCRFVKGQTSVGTPIELYMGKLTEKPMFIITDMKDSVYMKYISSSPNVEVHDVNNFGSDITNAYKTLRAMINDVKSKKLSLSKAYNTLAGYEKAYAMEKECVRSC